MRPSRQRIVAVLLAGVFVFTSCGGGGAGAGGGGGAAGVGGEAPSGAVASALQPATDGWSFPNFPSSSYPDVNFDETDLVSMFGSDETICVGGVAEPCKLTAEAAAWARMVNQSRASGHCEGLVALASSRFNNKETPSTVKLPSQDETLHAIMRTFATQFLPEVQASITKWMAASFEEKIDELKKSFAAGTLQYTLGVYTQGGGHAVLPYAIEYPTPDAPRIMLYDSNWPGKNRYVDIDVKAKTWRFSFSGEDPAADPDAWTGGPQAMDLTPFDARQGTCPFCDKDVKVAKNTMLIRSSNLDWSVEANGQTVTPESTSTDGSVVVQPVKGLPLSAAGPTGSGALKRESYDYLVQVTNDVSADDVAIVGATTTTAAVKAGNATSLNFTGPTAVFALTDAGIAQFTTPGTSGAPITMTSNSISTKDPGVDLTLASGNLVANASGSAVSLSVEGGTMAVSVTAPNGQVIEQQVSVDKPTLQMKVDEAGGGITVLAASSTGVVEKTEVSATGETTKSVVEVSLDLSEVKAELPAALASKEIAALPSLADRDMANPDYKVDAAYSAPTTVPSKSGDQVAEAAPTTLPAKGAAAVDETSSSVSVRNAALPTTVPSRGSTTTVDDDKPTPTTVVRSRSVGVAQSGSGAAATVTVKPTLGRFDVAPVTFGDAAFTVNEPSSNSSGGWRFTSSRTDVATVSALTGRVTITGAGSSVITASQSAVKGFEAVTVSDVLVVSRDIPTLGAFTAAGRTFGDEAFTLKEPSSNSTGVFSFDSSDDTVLRVNKTTGRAVVTGAGRATVTVAQAPTTDFFGAAKSFVLVIKKGVPEFGVFADVSRVFGEPEFVVPKPVSDSSAGVTFTSSNTGVAVVDGVSGRVSVVGAGTTSVTAVQAGNNDFFGTSKSMVLTVRQATPVIGAIAGAAKTFGDAEFVIAKPSSSSSGGFSFSSGNSDVVRVDGDGRVTVVGAGSATVTATQAATANFVAGSVSATVTVAKAATSIANLVLNNLTYGASDVTLAPRSNNPSPFAFTSNTPSVLAVNASTGRVTVVGAGTATITVRQGSSANFEAGSESITVQIARATPALSSFSALSKDYGDAPFALTPPVSNSPAPFTYMSSNSAVASVNETTGVVTLLNVTNVGSPVVLTARQAQTDNYVATSATTTLSVGRGTPVFGNFTVPDKIYGAAQFTVVPPSSTSAGAFTYSVVDVDGVNEAAVATVTTAGTVTIAGVGTITIRATQASTSLFVGSSITSTLTIATATPVFGSFTVPAKTFGDAVFTVSAPSSVSAGAFSFMSSNSAVATMTSAGVVTIVGAGSSTITATQLANGVYSQRSVTATLSVAKTAAPLSGFGGQASGLAGVRYVGYYRDDVNWFATAPRHGDTATSVSIENFSSSPGNNNSVDNYSWQWTGSFRASVSGSYNFCTNSDDASHMWLGANATSGFTTSNSLVNNGGTHGMRAVCGNISLTAGVDYPIRVQFGEAGGGDLMNLYFTPPGGAQTYNGAGYYFTGGGLTKTVGDAAFTPTLPASASDGAITYSSTNASVATIDPNTGLITVIGGGTTTIIASQAETANYAATNVSTVLTVLLPANLGAFTIPSKTFGAPSFPLVPPSSSSNGAFTYTSSNTAIASVNATTGVVAVNNIGSVVITATQAATATYAGATTTATLLVEGPILTQLSLAYHNSCGLTTEGGMKCWGYNGWGQIGSAASGIQTTPIHVPSYTSDVSAISAGHHHTCAVATNGAVNCWGYGGNGQTTPQISAGAVAISSGYQHSCALMAPGGVKCWGWNGYGQLGDGTTTSRSIATDVIGLSSGVVAIAAGFYHTCALLSTGGVKCWGSNDQQQLGDGATGRKSAPTQVTGLTSGVASISAGVYHTCAVLATGAAKCWGANDYGQLGDASNSYRSVPANVSTLGADVAAITAGWEHTCARLTTGAAKCWGRNNEGALGDGTNSSRNVPVNVVGLSSGVVSIEANQSQSTCATVTSNNVKCWGFNEWGQLGDGTRTHRNTPVDVTSLNSGSETATTLGALTLPSSRYTVGSADFTLNPPSSSRAGAVTFFSSNTEIATVNATTGLVRIQGSGNAVLAATIGGTGQYSRATSTVTLTVNTACEAGGLCSVGDTGPGGGKVFYDAGSNQSWGRYLEAAPGDLSTAMAWCNDTSSVIGATGYVVGTGNANTVAMDAACTSGAGQSAADYANNGYSDWYLPSLNELTEMFNGREALGGFATASYWSSSEENGEFAKRLGFPDGGMTGHVKSQGFRVRPVRAFVPLTDCQLGLSCAVGDIGPAGGHIIYVNPAESNEYDYVEAGPSDIAPTVWCSGPKATTLIGGTDSWRRQANAAQSHFATQLRNCTTGGGLDAHNYSANGFSGWGVPNIDLVQLMRTNLYANNVGDFMSFSYMTSNEQDQNTAITVDMTNGSLAYPAKTVATRLRPVRFFAKADRRETTPTLAGLSVPSNSFVWGDPDFTVSTTGTGINDWGGSFTSLGAITYTSSNTAVATVNAYTGLVSIVSPGSFTITATQSAWGIFKAPTAVANNFSVSNATPTLTGFALPSGSFRADDAPFDVVPAVTNSPGAITYSSANTSVATVNATTGRVTLTGAGTVTLTATVAASGYWNARSTTAILTVGALCADGGECRVGDTGPGGGKVFMLAASEGNTTGKFFEAAPADLDSAMAWCNDDTTSISGATGLVLGTGEANTVAMDAGCTSGAGQSAADYTTAAASDWYLPSLDELTAMLAARTTIGGFATASYWSSSEENGQFAKRLGFPGGDMSGHVKSQGFQVRPIRSFEIRRSCLDIKNSTGTNANGAYTIALSVGGAVVNTQVYCLMDSAMDGGGWTLVMKAPQNSTAFYYSSNYWTTANTLNSSSTSNVTAGATDAKFDTFNYMPATDMLAVFPDVNTGSFGTERGSIDSQNYGWTWKQTVPSGPKTPLAIFSGAAEQFISDAYLYSGFDTRVWTRQRDIRFYGFNWDDNYKARWGFGWNENGGGLYPGGYKGSDDATGGIGLNWGNYSAGDGSFCCVESTGLNRSMSFEMFVR